VDATELLLIAMRALHALAAIVWIGSIWFELFVLGPAWEHGPPPDLLTRIDVSMREIVQTVIIVFLVSGAILTFERLSRGAADTPYVLLLGIKIVLSLAMFQVGFRYRGARGPRRVRGLKIMAALGLAIVLVATVLKSIYERALLPS
jgi:putative copper export protein